MAPSKTSLALLFVDKKTVVIGVLIVLAAFIVGILIGHFGSGGTDDGDNGMIGKETGKIVNKYLTDQFKNSQVQY